MQTKMTKIVVAMTMMIKVGQNKGGEGGGDGKMPPTRFFPITSTNVGLSPSAYYLALST